eukprot:s2271_g3.t1
MAKPCPRLAQLRARVSGERGSGIELSTPLVPRGLVNLGNGYSDKIPRKAVGLHIKLLGLTPNILCQSVYHGKSCAASRGSCSSHGPSQETLAFS